MIDARTPPAGVGAVPEYTSITAMRKATDEAQNVPAIHVARCWEVVFMEKKKKAR